MKARMEQAGRVTLRRLAEAAGTSAMTVSRALNNRGRIAGSTRARILKLAERLGYRPDPEVAKLMHYLREGRPRSFHGVLCGLSTHAPGHHSPYFDALVAGARRQAGALGYGFELMPVPARPASSSSLGRILGSRGIEGLLLLPQPSPTDFSKRLPWESFSAVSVSASVEGPCVHQVLPDQFANTLQLCRRLAALSCKRIGIIITEDQDLRVGHRFTAAVLWHGRQEQGTRLAPLLVKDPTAPGLVAWYRKERPDAIIAINEATADHYARTLASAGAGPLRFASTSGPLGETTSFCGIDERPAEIGAAAVDLLARLVERRQRGLPEHPTTTLLPGRWLAGGAGLSASRLAPAV
jgi:DNA-binding LacI/PurR family transcriptional regulator